MKAAQAPVTVIGNDVSTALVVDRSSALGGNQGTLTASNVVETGVAAVVYQNVKTLTLNLSAYPDAVYDPF